MKSDIRQYYKNCPECLEFKKTKAQQDTEVSYENLFENFLPGQQVQCDFAEYGGQDYHLIADEISVFLKVTKNKSTKEALRSLREWSCIFGAPYRAKTDNGPSHRDEFQAECKLMGINVLHYSCYNAPSQG